MTNMDVSAPGLAGDTTVDGDTKLLTATHLWTATQPTVARSPEAAFGSATHGHECPQWSYP